MFLESGRKATWQQQQGRNMRSLKGYGNLALISSSYGNDGDPAERRWVEIENMEEREEII